MIYLRKSHGQPGWFAAPNGSAGNDGTVNHPWDLQTALNGGTGGTTIQPGDTLWLRGGTYTGQFTSSLVGTPGAPINVMQYGRGTSSRERVKIDCYNASNNLPGLYVGGSYARYHDIEVYSSNIVRTSGSAGSVPPNGCNWAFDYQDNAHDIKMINCVAHDTAEGFNMNNHTNYNTEVYGGLAYYVGWDGPDRGHGHTVYINNNTGTKIATDCIFHNSFDVNVQVYTGAQQLNNITVQGTTAFDGGKIDTAFSSYQNIVIQGNGQDMVVDRCYTYHQNSSVNSFPFGDGIGSYSITNWRASNCYIPDNWTWGSDTLHGTIVIDANTVLLGGFDPGFDNTYGTNSFPVSKTGLTVFVRPNIYEVGRGNITVFNWDHSSTVSVDVSSVGLANGDHYEARHSMDFYGTAVASGTYSGANITIPMTGLPIATPANYSAPAGPFPEFAAFVIWKV